MTVKVFDVEGDGSCFFRAIYWGAKKTNLLDKLVSCFGLETQGSRRVLSENDFVDQIRGFIAYRLEQAVQSFPFASNNANGNTIMANAKNSNPQSQARVTNNAAINSIYNTFVTLKSFDRQTYNMVLRDFPPWYKTAFRYPLRDPQTFFSQLAKNMRQRDKWIGQLEFRFIEETLNACSADVKIVIHTDRIGLPSTLYQHVFVDGRQLDVVHVYNVNENHYRYLIDDSWLACNATALQNISRGRPRRSCRVAAS
jgi:hypothetical protein